MSYKTVHIFLTSHNKVIKLPDVPSQIASSDGPIVWYRKNSKNTDWAVKIIDSNKLIVPEDTEYEITYYKEIKYVEYFCQDCSGHFQVNVDDMLMEDLGQGFYRNQLNCPYCKSQNCMEASWFLKLFNCEKGGPK